VSPSYLAKCTRRHLATTPTALISEIRLEHAAGLLVGTNDAVHAIANRCGFGNASHFGVAFRRTHGITPLEFRQRFGGSGRT
jgi:AraC-like DNA-binding protein